jgi:hypothetical protein
MINIILNSLGLLKLRKDRSNNKDLIKHLKKKKLVIIFYSKRLNLLIKLCGNNENNKS